LNKFLIYLVQTDTTVGFLSSDNEKLSLIKGRDKNKKILQVVDSFKTLQKYTRVPKSKKKFIRRSKLATYIYPNGCAFRVIDKNSSHHNFVNKFKCLYSTSANITGENFNKKFTYEKSEIILYEKKGFSQKSSSSIYKLTNGKLRKFR
jgi:tRNA A37 threonylcarbamoyladenosine synthetase subunit TsaC/SUA5/YrdC